MVWLFPGYIIRYIDLLEVLYLTEVPLSIPFRGSNSLCFRLCDLEFQTIHINVVCLCLVKDGSNSI